MEAKSSKYKVKVKNSKNLTFNSRLPILTSNLKIYRNFEEKLPELIFPEDGLYKLK